MTWNGSHVTYSLEGEIALVGLNRSQKRNAIDDPLLTELLEAAERAEAEARAVVVFGHGEHFSAGLDLGYYVKQDQLGAFRSSRRWHHVFSRIQMAPIPWIAALHGAVIGGGLELAAAAHIRVADQTAFFALPEGQRGIFVGGGGSVRIARLMGAARMADMMLTGRVASVEEAERWGVLQYVVDAGEALSKARELAQRTTENSELSNLAVTQALPRIQEMSLEDGLFVEALVATFTSTSQEANERLNAFLAKRTKKLEKPKT